MKKIFALVLAVAMVLSLSTAFATLGWSQSIAPSATANKGVSINVKALEFSGTSYAWEQYGLTNATVWKEITGKVVKDTLVKFPIKVSIPSASAAGLSTFDYANPAITVNLTNATAWKIVDGNGNDLSGSFTASNNGHKLVTSSLTLDSTKTNEYAFTVLAIVDSTAEINCTVNFTMGQKVSSNNDPMYFGGYTLYWLSGDHFTVMKNSTGARIDFVLDANNKFTSGVYFFDNYLPFGGAVPVNYCLNGELAFNGCCGCNKEQWPSNIISVAWYEQVKADFNEIMNAIGFNFAYGNFAAAYCTEAGIASLIKAVNASASVKVGGCTELAVGAMPNVPATIPQTGAVSILGYALVTLAGAALAISKKK